MSVRGPLVAECEGVSPEEVEAFLEEWTRERDSVHVEREGLPERAWWRCDFACCDGVATYWATNLNYDHTPPPCPVCDPVGARRGDPEALDQLARDVIAAGPERVAVLIDVAQDGRPLGRLQHPDDKAEIERLRAENDQLRAANVSLGKHFDQRVDALARRPWLPEDD